MSETQRVLKFGKKYRIIDPEDERYCYAVPVDYADGMWLGDCWIVDENDKIDPGYSVSPVPFHIDSLQDIEMVQV